MKRKKKPPHHCACSFLLFFSSCCCSLPCGAWIHCRAFCHHHHHQYDKNLNHKTKHAHTHTHPYKPSQPNTRGHIFLHGSEPFACFLIGIFACLLFPTTSHHTDTNTTSDNRQPQWSISRLLRPLWPPWEPPLRKYTIIIITDNNIKNHRSAPVITTTTKTLGNPELEVNNGGCGRIFTGNLYGRGNARRKPFAGT